LWSPDFRLTDIPAGIQNPDKRASGKRHIAGAKTAFEARLDDFAQLTRTRLQENNEYICASLPDWQQEGWRNRYQRMQLL